MKSLGEFGLIRRLTSCGLHRQTGVVRGVGDDAAVLSLDPTTALITTDMLVEGVHFTRNTLSCEDLGFKALSVNLSDIAAMGGEPRDAFVSLAIPPTWSLSDLEQLYRGLNACAREFHVNILGGDTTRSSRELVINVTLWGVVPEGEPVYRDRACEGDVIAVTGWLGESRAGLQILRCGIQDDRFLSLVQAHRRPRAHVPQGRVLQSCRGVHAMMDISDGLSSDLPHLLEHRGLGARIQAASLPLSPELLTYARHVKEDALALALSGGEDYVLLVTIAPEALDAIQSSLARAGLEGLHPIGHIVSEKGSWLEDAQGRCHPIQPTGWDPFARPSS